MRSSNLSHHTLTLRSHALAHVRICLRTTVNLRLVRTLDNIIYDVLRHLQSRGAGIKKPLHPIKIVIVRGAEDVTIKVADRGGGIPRSKIDHIWKFAHSTTSEEEESSDFGVDQVTGSKIRGFGLPLARIYARYFGGELTLKSMEGYGLDAYLYLPRLGENCENLPSPVRQSPAMDISLPRMGLQTTASTTRN
mmetsp:Transcript_13257/g.36616  ORF Transcript_13257/g.36616 Transcript_13257/m.36616 type:complete len:193 (-) Transcript_13257:417-995(-)